MRHSSHSKGPVARYRERMYAQGFRPVQIWVPDTRSATFAAECQRQSQLIADMENKKGSGVNDWLDDAADDIEGWKA